MADTPLSWLLFALNLMGYFFLSASTRTLLTAPQAAAGDGRDRRQAALLQVGGTVGALSLCWWLQRHRFLAISFLFVLAVPVVGSIGFAGLTSQAALLTATFFARFVVLGIQIGINVVGAMLYPTSLRANGSGAATRPRPRRLDRRSAPRRAVRRHAAVRQLYMWSALPFAAGAIVCFAIHVFDTARLKAHPDSRRRSREKFRTAR